MKLKHYLGVPFMGTVALLAFTGCSDELESGKNNIPQGNGIVFGASAQYAGPITRVAYGDYDFTEGHEGEFGFRESQDITWESTDQVSIYSPTSPSQQQVDYGIQNIDGKDASEAYLAAINGQDGLQWDRTSATQDFYAVYPSKASITNTQIRNLVSFENGVLTGYVPINQEHTITKSGNTWTAKPNMNWLYMAAINKGYNVPAPDAEQDGISLDFVPLVTTLEITFVGPTEQPIASFNVESNSEPVTGQFRCDLREGNTTTDGIFNNVPKCESLQQHTTNTYATVSTYWNDGDTRKPLTLAAGEEITFNVFLLPNQNLDNVTIRVAGFNTSSRTLSLKSQNVVLKPHQKTCIRVQAPKINAGETNEWISGLNDNVLVSQLSIPGTANSFSYMYDGGTNSHIYQAQTKNIDAQWNAGIRCFELVCSEKYDNYNNNNSSPNVRNLADANLGCNRTNIGMTFGDAVEAIWNKVNGTGEFAIIIPTYESGTGHPGDHNGVISFANALNAFYDSRNYKYQTYSSTLTVGEARGHLLFIARITSEEDENGDYMPQPAKGIFVDQWGSLKDNWARRGYTISGTVVNNWGTSTTDPNSMESYMLYRGGNVPSIFPERVDANTNFMHSSTRHDGSKGTAYIQDWMRVVPDPGVIKDLQGAGGYTLQDGGWSRDYNVYWNESLTEKQDDIWNTFIRSIQQNSTDNPDAFYINSLDGYFVDQNIRESFTPYVASGTWGVGLSSGGTGGNIGAWATHINNYFYNKILEFGEDNIYGPMNIVLMDRVYADDPSSYLPSVIVNNNYRFPLRTADGGTTQNRSSDASYASGGSVWK